MMTTAPRGLRRLISNLNGRQSSIVGRHLLKAQSRVKHVTQAIAQEVDRQHCCRQE